MIALWPLTIQKLTVLLLGLDHMSRLSLQYDTANLYLCPKSIYLESIYFLVLAKFAS